MSTDYWGPLCWRMIHTISYSYNHNNLESKNEYKHFFIIVLPKLIPCPKCKIHWEKNISKYPPNLKDKNSLVKWVVFMHNLVNIENKKRTFSFKEVNKIYYNQNFNQEIFRFLLFIRKEVQLKYIDQNSYNQCLYFLNKYVKLPISLN